MWNDDIWDEDRWEAFLRENDRRLDRYMELLHDFMVQNPRPSDDDPGALAAWEGELRAFLDIRGWTQGDPLWALLWPGGPEDAAGTRGADDEASTGEEVLDEHPGEGEESVWRLPVYRHALDLATEVLYWTDDIPGSAKDSVLVQFCANLMQIPAKVAKGHRMGYEKEFIGGNIACVKRGLAAANDALELLRTMKGRSYLDAPTYRRFYEQLYEVRNEVGLYVQALRERFDLGID